MPIRPENRARYPANWQEIRAAILLRAGFKCEGSPQYPDCRIANKSFRHGVRIVLTIGHLDHVPENCAPANLRAWCQRCHLCYDAKHHAQTARATRRAGRAHGDLFGALK